MNKNSTLVVIDAGHGGIDSGAVGNGLEEKDLNLKAAKYIYNRLQELNIPVVITRTEDEYLPKNKRIERIKTITNNNPNTLLISNHMNAGSSEGAEIVYSLKNNSTFSDLILDNLEKKGQIKRKSYQRRLPENPNLDYYYILRESNSNEPILLEYGFIDNINDSKKLSNNLDDYAEAVVESIATYLNYPYQANNNSNEYTIKKGDTLYSISKKYNISVDELKRINNLINNDLSIGQVLLLKEKSNNPLYIVQRGDTLYSIAKNNNISVEDIISFNNLSDTNLYIGQELYLPSTNETNNSHEYDIYTVKKGDSLWSISRKYNITIPEIIDLNNLSDLTIQINQKLLVPKTEQNENIYVVQKGDSLWSISKKFDKSINEIKELNNLNGNLLSIGQELII